MADIRDTSKPNMISTRADYGTIQSGGDGWDTAAPKSDNDVNLDPYSPQMLGSAPGSMDHNSAWLDPTPEDLPQASQEN